MILSAQSIRRRCVGGGMIRPFHERTVYTGKTYGLSSAGYDVRVEFEVGKVIQFSAPSSVTHPFLGSIYDPGNTFALASTVERFFLPTDVMGMVHDKSSWARRGLTVQNTVIEPGWSGYLTLELIYHGEGELTVCEGDPIAQIVFHQLDDATYQPYEGKYQYQPRGPQKAIDE